MTFKLEVKPLVAIATVVMINIRVLTLAINEKQCKYPDTVQYNKEIDQSAASIRVELVSDDDKFVCQNIYVNNFNACRTCFTFSSTSFLYEGISLSYSGFAIRY